MKMYQGSVLEVGEATGLDFARENVINQVAHRPSMEADTGVEYLLPGQTERLDLTPARGSELSNHVNRHRRSVDHTKWLAKTGRNSIVLPGETERTDLPREREDATNRSLIGRHPVYQTADPMETYAKSVLPGEKNKLDLPPERGSSANNSLTGRHPVYQSAYPMETSSFEKVLLPGETERFDFPREREGTAEDSVNGRLSADYATCLAKTCVENRLPRERKGWKLPRGSREGATDHTRTRRHSTPNTSHPTKLHVKDRLGGTEELNLPEEREGATNPALLGRRSMDFTPSLLHTFLERVLPRQRDRLQFAREREGAVNHALTGRPFEVCTASPAGTYVESVQPATTLGGDDLHWDREGATSSAALTAEGVVWDPEWERELKRWEEDLRWEKDLKAWKNNLKWEREGAVNNSMIGRPIANCRAIYTDTELEQLSGQLQNQDLDWEREGATNHALTGRLPARWQNQDLDWENEGATNHALTGRLPQGYRNSLSPQPTLAVSSFNLLDVELLLSRY